jgi:hypothetical protein
MYQIVPTSELVDRRGFPAFRRDQFDSLRFDKTGSRPFQPPKTPFYLLRQAIRHSEVLSRTMPA